MKTEGLSKALEKARDNCTQLADMGVEKEMLEPFWQLMKESVKRSSDMRPIIRKK